jgi:hypothetical protein
MIHTGSEIPTTQQNLECTVDTPMPSTAGGQLLSSPIGSSDNSAHSCRHCLAVIIKRPSQEEIEGADDGHVLSIAEVDGAAVTLAASDGCTFFRWAIAGLNRLGIDVHVNWSLQIGVLQGHLHRNESSFSFVNVRWRHENGSVQYVGWLAVAAEQGMTTKGFQVRPQCPLTHSKMIRQPSTYALGLRVGVWRLKKL